MIAFSRIFITCGVLCLMILQGVSTSFGGEFQNALSLQGYTGLLNTPNAEVTDEGKVAALYSNQKESQWRNRGSYEESYLFSVGLFSFAELGGRFTYAPGHANDLSANFKMKVPFIPQGYYLPDIAFGMQDAGTGGLKKLSTKYVVASEELWRFRFSLGYGAGPDRMEGMFGGVELKAFDWLYLLAENDAKETNAGIRLVTPSLFGLPVNLQVTAKTSLDYKAGNTEFGIGLQIPLGIERHSKTQLPEKAAKAEVPVAEKNMANRSPAPPAPAPAVAPGGTDRQSDSISGLQLLREKLIAGGFQNVQVGADQDATLLVVEYENSRYNHNELDGLGVVVGTIVDNVRPGFQILRVVMKKKGIRILQVSAPLYVFRKILREPDDYGTLNDNLMITTNVAVDDEIRFIAGDANPSWLKSELLLYPGLKTYVGTEVGRFDYLLSLKTDYYLNAWKGAVLNARWDIPLDWSENFNDGKVFRDNRASSQLDRLMLFQALKVAPNLMLNLGTGMILDKTYGTINELMWTPGNGNHRFLLKQAYLSSSDDEALYPKNNVYLGSYRYYFGPLDLYLEGTAGQFLDKDRGFSVELKRFFGDTAFSIVYKNSRTEERPNSPSENVQMAGVMISIPLTPRRDMKPSLVQVKGNADWSYAQETKLVPAPGGTNYVNTSVGLDPQMAYNLEHVYYNRDRLSEDYIKKHLLRLRDAYTTYRLK